MCYGSDRNCTVFYFVFSILVFSLVLSILYFRIVALLFQELKEKGHKQITKSKPQSKQNFFSSFGPCLFLFSSLWFSVLFILFSIFSISNFFVTFIIVVVDNCHLTISVLCVVCVYMCRVAWQYSRYVAYMCYVIIGFANTVKSREN